MFYFNILDCYILFEAYAALPDDEMDLDPQYESSSPEPEDLNYPDNYLSKFEGETYVEKSDKYKETDPELKAEKKLEYYLRSKKPAKMKPYNKDSAKDDITYSADSTPTSELRDRYDEDREGLRDYFERKRQLNKDKRHLEALDELSRNHGWEDEHKSYLKSI
jgi:hypothetical protein